MSKEFDVFVVDHITKIGPIISVASPINPSTIVEYGIFGSSNRDDIFETLRYLGHHDFHKTATVGDMYTKRLEFANLAKSFYKPSTIATRGISDGQCRSFLTKKKHYGIASSQIVESDLLCYIPHISRYFFIRLEQSNSNLYVIGQAIAFSLDDSSEGPF
jgi:hypothetical protein